MPKNSTSLNSKESDTNKFKKFKINELTRPFAKGGNLRQN